MVEDLKRKHPSIPRNKFIADIFFKAGYIEAWGRGIQKIISGFVKAGHPVPTFEELAGGMQVTLYKSVVKSVPLIDSGSPPKLGDKLVDKLGDKLGDNQLLILESLKNNPYLSLSQLSSIVGISQTAIENNVSKLKKTGVLKRIGSPKGGHWEVLDK